MATGPETHISGDEPAASSASGLVNRRELAFAAVERTRMPMVVADPNLPDSPIVLANKAFLKLTGYSADEVIGHNCRFMQGPETDPAHIQQIRDGLAGEPREFVVDILNYRKDGSSFWNQLFISPICADDGTLRYYFASQVDISTQRQATELEASERRLLREIDHRAKNALALVQGIVRLSRADDAEAYAEAVQGRVDSLAQAHQLLSDAGWSTVPLERLIRTEVAAFGSRRVTVEGPPVDVPADQVQPLTLLIHELVANAAEHGALSTEAGRLEIGWERVDGKTIVRLRESGGPPPPIDRAPGFGMKMIDAFIRRQLRGDVAYSWRGVGLETVLTIPAATM